MNSQATFGIIGLGVMGRSLARNLIDHGERVVAWDREEAVREREGQELSVVPDLPALVAQLETPRRILIMVPAGAPVDAVLETLTPILDQEDIVIDGGNSRFEETNRREAELRDKGLHFVGMGVSGGEEGARRGPSLMPGGSEHAWRELGATLESIAAKTEAGPCVTHVGPGGAGHFVKIVHNGIEYADMQLLAEAYDLLWRAGGQTATQLAATFRSWNKGPLESYLTEITARIFEVKDEITGGPLVDMVLDKAGQKGTGRWTLEAALSLGVSVPTISAAVDARIQSSQKERRGRLARLYPSNAGELTFIADPGFRDSLASALLAARIASYAQGFELIRTASEAHEWNVKPGELARIWKGGCIIRARLLDHVVAAYREQPDLEGLLFHPAIVQMVSKAYPALRQVISIGQQYGIALPAFSASLCWLDSVRTARLPLNLTQAQRDAFGAHTYKRMDDPEGPSHHTDWLG